MDRTEKRMLNGEPTGYKNLDKKLADWFPSDVKSVQPKPKS
ncbi:hypothetical protein VAE122_2890071 [Vibrio aestuarianus]|nr:hypothetical protein VAE122_2890071 [Vibrio aestuarianus]